MATIIKINRTNAQGQQLISALSQIRDGIAILEKLNGQRAENIATLNGGAANFEANFGIEAGGGQPFSDRWEGFLTALPGDSNLNDLLNATIATTTATTT